MSKMMECYRCGRWADSKKANVEAWYYDEPNVGVGVCSQCQTDYEREELLSESAESFIADLNS